MTVDLGSRLNITPDQLAEFCRKWKIVRLEIFGSALREDFDPIRSDVDLMVTFSADTDWGLSDELQMEAELAELVGRDVDIADSRRCGADGELGPQAAHPRVRAHHI